MAAAPRGLAVAVTAEALYLANLTVLPGLAFVALAVLGWYWRRADAPLVRNHLRQTLWVSGVGGALIALVASSLLFVHAEHDFVRGGSLWVVVVLYFTVVHSTLVLFGILGLARAMAGQSFRFPLIGPRLLP
ncbi:MAG: hypothetical protein JSR54_02880 [Proteobacteria bacterium]|nr:hypothetical protein [Pseudomonadota bacterium]